MEPITASNTSSPAPYGRACTTCAHAKAKCVYHRGLSQCERCLRLHKDCQPSSNSRASKVKKRPTTKTARLEEKLDGLVSLLTAASQPQVEQDGAQTQVEASPALAQFGASPESLESRVASPGREGSGKNSTPANQDVPHKDAMFPNTQSVYFPDIKDYCGDPCGQHGSHDAARYQMSALFSDEADDSLDLFRVQMLRQFPFIIIPALRTGGGLRQLIQLGAEATRPDDVRKTSPFLWLCIMAFTTKSSERRKVLASEIRHVIGTKMIVEGQRNTDFLQGLLLYVSWGHYTIFGAPVILSSVMQLAVGMLGDLGLKRPPPNDSPSLLLNYDARGNPKPFLPAVRTLDDRRIAISCWSLSQFVSSYFQKIDTMRWIPYYDECLQLLMENGLPSDAFLVQLVKLQLIHEKVIHGPWHDLGNGFQPSEQNAKSTACAPAAYYVKALQNELDRTRDQMRPDLQQNPILMLYGYNTELSIHEVALSKAFDSGYQRLDSLWASLQATKNWFDLFLQIPPAEYVAIPFALYSQFAHCIVALSRLSTYEHPDWNFKLARNSCSMSSILDDIIDRFLRVKSEARLEPNNPVDTDIFSSNARRLGAIKQWWETKLAAEELASAENQLEESTTHDPMLSGPPIDFSDDGWLRDLMSLDEHQFSQFLK